MRVRALKDLQFSPPLKDTPKHLQAGTDFDMPEDLVEISVAAGDVEAIDEDGNAVKTRKKGAAKAAPATKGGGDGADQK